MRFNYLSTDQDRREWVEAIRVARDILGQPAMDPFNGGEISPGPSGGDRRADPRLGAQGRRDRAAPQLHLPHGRRGRRQRGRPADDEGVGREGLRVCDASAMRYVTNGNIYAPVMMMAEKAADLIDRRSVFPSSLPP
jgi:choline dehydrogenase